MPGGTQPPDTCTNDCSTCGGGGGGGGPPPPNVTGYHDAYGNNSGDSGGPPNNATIQDQALCAVTGWAADPDNLNTNVQVRILVDGTQIMQMAASNFRGDLGGVCTGGTCQFYTNIYNLITPNTQHNIQVEAQDLNTGDWVRLGNSPRTLQCRGGRIQGRRYDFCPNGAITPLTVSGVGTYNLNKNYIQNPPTTPNNPATNAYTTGSDILPLGNVYNVGFLVPAGYTAQYSYCQNSTNHPDGVANPKCGPWTTGGNVNVQIPASYATGQNFAYVDLYWRCQPLPGDCASITPNATTNQVLSDKTFTINNVTNASSVNLIASISPSMTNPVTIPASTSNGTTYTADVDMGDQNLWAPTLYLQAEVVNSAFPSTIGCTTQVSRQVTVTGQIYDDGANTPTYDGINVNCTSGGGTPTTTNAGGATATIVGATCTVSAGGLINCPNVPLGSSNKSLSLVLGSGWTSTCPAPSPTFSMNEPYYEDIRLNKFQFPHDYRFFASLVESPWFQVKGGNLRAQSSAANAVHSLIPDSCVGTSCFLNRKGDADINSAGYPIVDVGGTVSTDDPPSTLSKISESGAAYNLYGQSGHVAPRQDYNYFYQLYDLGSTPTSLSAGAMNDLDMSDLLLTDPNYVAHKAYFAKPAGGTVTITGSIWTVNGGRKVVVFINGNLNITNSRSITVDAASGSFLAFIVSGNITFDSSIGVASTASEVPTIEGVYIADGTLSLSSSPVIATPKKFVGAGTFVGWTSLTFQRDIGFGNNTIAAELFIARPDFALNAPSELKHSVYDWQEVAP